MKLFWHNAQEKKATPPNAALVAKRTLGEAGGANKRKAVKIQAKRARSEHITLVAPGRLKGHSHPSFPLHHQPKSNRMADETLLA